MCADCSDSRQHSGSHSGHHSAFLSGTHSSGQHSITTTTTASYLSSDLSTKALSASALLGAAGATEAPDPVQNFKRRKSVEWVPPAASSRRPRPFAAPFSAAAAAGDGSCVNCGGVGGGGGGNAAPGVSQERGGDSGT